jgi:hypothetical protein
MARVAGLQTRCIRKNGNSELQRSMCVQEQRGHIYALIPLKNPSGRPGLFFWF